MSKSNSRILPKCGVQIDGLNLTPSTRDYNFLILGKRRCGRTSIMQTVTMGLLDKGETVLYFGNISDVVNPGFFFNQRRDLFYDNEMHGSVDWFEGQSSFSCKE